MPNPGVGERLLRKKTKDLIINGEEVPKKKEKTSTTQPRGINSSRPWRDLSAGGVRSSKLASSLQAYPEGGKRKRIKNEREGASLWDTLQGVVYLELLEPGLQDAGRQFAISKERRHGIPKQERFQRVSASFILEPRH